MAVAARQLQRGRGLPILFSQIASPHVLDDISSSLPHQGPIATIFLVLRATDGAISSLKEESDGSYWLSETLSESFAVRIATIREEWRKCVGSESPWNALLEFRGIHACGLRGPSSCLQRLLACPVFRSAESPVAGTIRPFPLRIPEQAIDLHILEDMDEDSIERLEHLDQLFRGIPTSDLGALGDHAFQLLERPQVIAALDFYQRVIRKLPWLQTSYVANNMRRILTRLGPGGDYINHLGIGNLDVFGPTAGDGQRIILLDSGADESVLFLQGRILDYTRFDGASQQKKAHDCVDSACHGTKMAAVISGGSVRLRDIGFTDEYVGGILQRSLGDFGLNEMVSLRPGIAPGARLAVAEVLHGDVFMEVGGAHELVAGLNWAAEQYLSGYHILNVSIEADPSVMTKDDQRTIDGLFDLMKMHDIVPVVASGNRGADSAPVSREAIVVGAAQTDGKPFLNNGPLPDVLAPGEDVLCGQPRLQKLRNLIVGVHTGSSFATAIMSGCIAVLADRFNTSAVTAASALVRSSNGGIVSLDLAAEELRNDS